MNRLNPNTLILFFVIATIPLLSAVTLPLINGLYIFATILAAGIWLVLNFEKIHTDISLHSSFLILFIIVYIALTTLNLPMQIIQAISPVRADSLINALQTGQFSQITTALSYYIPGSQFYAVYGLTLFLLFYFCSTLVKSDGHLNILLWVITAVGFLEAVHGICQVFFPDIGFLRLPGSESMANSPTGTFADHFQYAAFLNMCWPVSLVLGLSLIKELFEKIEILKLRIKTINPVEWIKLAFHHAILPLWSTAFILAAIILSRSATGIIVMFILVLLCRIVIPYPRPVKIIFSGVIYTALLMYGWALGIQGISDRFTAFLQLAHEKFSFWSGTLAMLLDHPYSGIGMGAFKFMAPLYLPLQPGTQPMNHAQNDYLEFALELGLPITLLFCIWLLAGFLFYCISIYRMPRKLDKMTRDEIYIIGSFYALSGIALTSAVTSVFHTPALAFYAVTVLAILHSIILRSRTDKEYTAETLFPQKKRVSFVPYRKPARRPYRR